MSDKERPPHLELVQQLLKAISRYSVATGYNSTGTTVVERPGKGHDAPMIVMYATYGNGDWLCWFADAGKMHLYILVNDSIKHIKSVLTSDVAILQQAIDEWKPKLGKKKKKKS